MWEPLLRAERIIELFLFCLDQNILVVILPCSGSFYEEDYDEDYDYDDNNYIDSTYGTKKEYSSSSKKKVGWDWHSAPRLLAGINDFPVAVVEFSFSVHFVLCAENFIVVISK